MGSHKEFLTGEQIEELRKKVAEVRAGFGNLRTPAVPDPFVLTEDQRDFYSSATRGTSPDARPQTANVGHKVNRSAAPDGPSLEDLL